MLIQFATNIKRRRQYKYCKTDYTLAHGSDVNLVSGTRQVYYRHQKSLFASPDKFVSNIRQVCFRHQTSLFPARGKFVTDTKKACIRHLTCLFPTWDKFVSATRQVFFVSDTRHVCFRNKTSCFRQRHSSAFPHAIFAAPPAAVSGRFMNRISPILRIPNIIFAW